MRSIRYGLLFLMLGLVLSVGALILPHSAFASATDGTIDPANSIAKGTNPAAGRFNFYAANGNVHVLDSGLTGYVWSENFGWINLNPSNGGVLNNAEGTLSGNAWGQSTGWINFKPTNGGVTIDSNGIFHGYAWAANAGWISFNCANNSSCGTDDFKVVTDWRPASTRTPPPSGGGGGGGSGGYIPPVTPPATTTPTTTTPCTVNCSNTTTPPCTVNCNGTTTPPCTVNCGNQPPATTTPVCTVNCTGSEPCTVNCENPGEEPCTVNCTNEPPCTVNCTNEPPCTVNCEPSEPQPPTTNPVEIVQEIINSLPARFEALLTPVQQALREPAAAVATKVITTTGLIAALATGVVGVLFANPVLVADIFMIPVRLLSLLFSSLGLKRRARPWGTVYDSVTKMPLDPAYVSLKDETGKEIATSFTDLDGRYGFFVPKGTYYMTAEKTHYLFPSKKMAGRLGDELYTDLYFGEKIEVPEDGAVIFKNIPLDQENFDWNEFAKNNMKVMKFHSKRERLLTILADWIFRIGFAVAAVSLFAAPEPYNLIIFFTYLLVLGFRLFGFKRRTTGAITERATGLPLSFAIVTIYSNALQRDLMKKVADQYGRYYALVPTGEYTIKISRKNPDETYTEIASQVYNAKEGVVNFDMKV